METHPRASAIGVLMFPLRHDVPCLTTEQMIEVDRSMIEDYGIDLVQMMENAGRHLAHLARVEFLGGTPEGRHAVILAGTGGNGGGALVCARRLVAWGADVTVVTTARDVDFTAVPAHQLRILRAMDVPVVRADGAPVGSTHDLVVDGLIGYSLRGAPRGDAKTLVTWANEQSSPVLSLDVPSGIDAGSGKAFTPAVPADATLTLALPKCGLMAKSSEDHVGHLYLADIGVPPALYSREPLEIEVEVEAIFAESDIVQVLRRDA